MSSEVPKGWQEIRIGKIAREISVRNRDATNIPVLSVTKHNGFVRSSEYFSRSVHSEDTSNYKIVRKGQFAYATIHLDEGSIALLRDFDRGLISPMYTVFEIYSDRVCSDYLFRCLKRFALSGRFDPYSNGGVNRRKSISFSDLKAFLFALPSLAEQRAIAEVLGAVEEAIAKQEAVINSIADAKLAVMRELLTHGIRRDKAILKPLPARWIMGRVAEGVTHIPADWELVTLAKVAKLESGHTPDRKEPSYWDGLIPWISLQDAEALGKLKISDTAETIGPEGLANSSARMLPAGTVVLQRTANVGLASVMGREMCTSQHFANWICGPKLNPYYLQQIFRHMSREWLRLVAGSVLPDIYMGTFKALQILLPPVPEQKKIGEIGAAFDRRIEHEQAVLVEMRQSRAALAQELLSGRLRLPDSMIARHRDKPEQAA